MHTPREIEPREWKRDEPSDLSNPVIIIFIIIFIPKYPFDIS